MAAANLAFLTPVAFTRSVGVRFKPECDKVKKLILQPEVKQECRFQVDGKAESYDGNPLSIVFEFESDEMELTTSSWDLGQGEVALTNITTKKEGEFVITVKVNGEKTNEIKVISKLEKDVFTEEDTNRLVQEIEYIQPFADAETGPEYDENYCMQAAERGLSELLENTTDFYAVARGTHAQVSGIGFSGLTAIDRGNKMNTLGFVKTSRSFNGYIINQSDRDTINNSANAIEAKSNYDSVKYSIISLSAANKTAFYNQFILELKDNYGFHVYYMSITGGFHTLLLVIDYRDPCNAEYKIYDQHGLTSSSGALADVADGFVRQTSWTFANTCLNRYLRSSTKHWDSTETKLWKIQRK